ncbi:M23 family peptidase, partial [Xanthomonadaceae bacterium JHOS43]|nr:M23 family peptidase [Xanthomonadaceae bacterium JHOS43]
EVEQQRAEFDSAKNAAQRELNAMSVKLAELQAESTRINALDARLTKIARMDDGEFNFDEPPAVGGPRTTTGELADHQVVAPTGVQLCDSIDALSRRISVQSQQLLLLESVL